MKKLIGVCLLGLIGLMATSKVEAASVARSAKQVASINYTTTLSSVAVTGAAVVYGVFTSTGVSGTDFTSLWDAASIGSLVTNNTGSSFKGRINVSSTTQNTFVIFDPPLQFNNGIIAGNSSAANWAQIIFERGRVTQGY